MIHKQYLKTEFKITKCTVVPLEFITTDKEYKDAIIIIQPYYPSISLSLLIDSSRTTAHFYNARLYNQTIM